MINSMLIMHMQIVKAQLPQPNCGNERGSHIMVGDRFMVLLYYIINIYDLKYNCIHSQDRETVGADALSLQPVVKMVNL